jgi:DNA invertase Pin-like site-specific DNA recombinase
MHLPPLDGYIRISRVGDRGGESYISPDIQAKAITRKAKEIGRAVILHEPEENVSGGTMNRPIFNTIMDRIRSGESGGMVVYKLDRFARNLIGGYQALAEIAALNALFVSASEPQFDFSTPSGRMILQQHLMFAEYWREISKESWANSVTHAVGRGIHPGPYGAYGYDRTESGRFVIVADVAPFVQEAYRLRVEERMPYRAIADFLNDQAPPRADGRPWAGSSVQRMITRRVYRGEAFYGRIQNKTGKDAVVNTDAHEPLISEELFLAANQPVQAWSKKRQGDDALLQGLVRCAGCRYRASPGMSGKIRTYHCHRRHVSGLCPAAASVSRPRLERYVDQLVADELHRRLGAFVGTADSDELHRAKEELADARTALNEMRSDTTARKRLGSRWLDFIEPYVAEEERASAKLADIASRTATSVTGMTADAYLTLSPSDRRAVLGAMIDAVMILRRPPGAPTGRGTRPLDDSRVLVLWRGQAPPDLPAKSRFAADGIKSFQWPEGERQAEMVAA